MREFLYKYTPPGDLARLLRDYFRAFCLTLNALKQWLSAEQLATDCDLLGGTGRQTLKDAAKVCTVTGEPLATEDLELHHPARDGRLPIPVSKEAHRLLEKQVTATRPPRKQRSSASDKPREVVGPASPEEALMALKRSGTWSWVMLRKGCLDLLGLEAGHTTKAVGASSRAFARRAMDATGRDLRWILSFLEARAYGL